PKPQNPKTPFLLSKMLKLIGYSGHAARFFVEKVSRPHNLFPRSISLYLPTPGTNLRDAAIQSVNDCLF
ncbi:MAG: hypothetical protein ACKO96_20995, partial [Flammeovirgaceae bacterium]